MLLLLICPVGVKVVFLKTQHVSAKNANFSIVFESKQRKFIGCN